MRHQTQPHELGDTVRDLLEAHGWAVERGCLVPPQPLPVHSPLTPPSRELSERLARTIVDLDALAYLSDGEQNAIDIMNSRIVRLRGRGELDL
jgi:hypothetical protein